MSQPITSSRCSACLSPLPPLDVLARHLQGVTSYRAAKLERFRGNRHGWALWCATDMWSHVVTQLCLAHCVGGEGGWAWMQELMQV